MWSDKFFVSYGMSNKCIQRRLELLQRWDDLGCKALCTALEAGSRTVCESIWVKGRFKNALLGSTNDLRKLCLDSYFDFLKNITAALRAPILGGNFAVWADLSALFQWHYRHSPSENLRVWRDAISQPEGGTFSCFDCSLQYIRRLEICFFPYPKSWSLGAAVPFLLSWFLIFYDPNITGTIPNSIHFPHLEGKTITGMQLHRASSLVACSKTCRHGLRFGNGATWGTWGTGTRCKRWLESSEPQRCDWLAQTRLFTLLLFFVICLNYRFFMNCLSLCLFLQKDKQKGLEVWTVWNMLNPQAVLSYQEIRSRFCL